MGVSVIVYGGLLTGSPTVQNNVEIFIAHINQIARVPVRIDTPCQGDFHGSCLSCFVNAIYLCCKIIKDYVSNQKLDTQKCIYDSMHL